MTNKPYIPSQVLQALLYEAKESTRDLIASFDRIYRDLYLNYKLNDDGQPPRIAIDGMAWVALEVLAELKDAGFVSPHQHRGILRTAILGRREGIDYFPDPELPTAWGHARTLIRELMGMLMLMRIRDNEGNVLIKYLPEEEAPVQPTLREHGTEEKDSYSPPRCWYKE